MNKVRILHEENHLDPIRERMLRQGGAFSVVSSDLIRRSFFPCGRFRIESNGVVGEKDAQLDELLPSPLPFLCYVGLSLSSDEADWLDFTGSTIELRLSSGLYFRSLFSALYFVNSDVLHFTLVLDESKRHGFIRLNDDIWRAYWGVSESAYAAALDHLRNMLGVGDSRSF